MKTYIAKIFTLTESLPEFTTYLVDAETRDDAKEQIAPLMTPLQGFELVAELKNLVDLRARTLKLESALRKIRDGSAPRGRWIDQETFECPDGDHHNPDAVFPGCEWEEYDAEEQTAWLESVAGIAERALE